MSATHCTQPPVKPADPVLKGIEESGRLPVALQSSGPPDFKDNHPTVHVDATPMSPLVDVEAKRVLSSPLPLPSDNSSNPPGVISPFSDADAGAIVLGASDPIDNVDASSLAECFYRLVLDVDAGFSALPTPRDICNVKLTKLNPTEVRAARQALEEAKPRLKSIAERLKETVLSVLSVLPDPAEPSAASGTSGPSPIPLEALDGAEVQSAMDCAWEARRLLLEALQLLAMECYWMGMKMWWYEVHLPAIEGNELA
ncbi:hypothetical protein V8D89_000289 [Ganoderma adspersum]